MSSAPVCNIPTGPTISDQPGLVNFPPIPQPTDLQSALIAINAMRQIIMQLTGQLAFNGAGGQGTGLGTIGNGPGQANGGTPSHVGPRGPSSRVPKGGQNRFTELKADRVTEKMRIFNPDDKTQYVDIERINRVVWLDQLTGQTVLWQR